MNHDTIPPPDPEELAIPEDQSVKLLRAWKDAELDNNDETETEAVEGWS